MFSNLLALKLEYAMSVYQKFRDCKTAGPFLCPCMIFARAWASHAHLLFTLAPDVSFQCGFLIYVKIRAGLRRKSSISLVDNLSRELRPLLCALRWGIDQQVRDRW